MAFIPDGKIVQRGTPRELVDKLGRHIVEIEGPGLGPLVQALRPRLGAALEDGDVAFFRYPEEDLTEIAGLQADLGGRVSALRIRRPNLNDVFLWVNTGQPES